MPKFTIVTSVYNHERFIAERVRSIIDQRERDWEWIIIDDCSSDGSYALLEKLLGRNPRVKLFKNERNLGFTLSTQRGFDIAEGEYIYRADSDDSCHPEFLSYLGRELDQDTSLSFVWSRAMSMNEAGQVWGGFPERRDYKVSGLDLLAMVVGGNFLVAPSILYRRSVVVTSGGFASIPSLRVNSDWLLTMNCLLYGGAAYFDRRLSYYRTHATNISRDHQKTKKPAELEMEMMFPLDYIYDRLKCFQIPPDFPSIVAAKRAAADLIWMKIVAPGINTGTLDSSLWLSMLRKHVPDYVPAPHSLLKSLRGGARSLAYMAFSRMTRCSVEERRAASF